MTDREQQLTKKATHKGYQAGFYTCLLKLRSEIERLKDSGCASPIVVCDNLLSIIDSLQEELAKFKIGDTIRPKGSKAEYTITSISGGCYHGKGWGLPIDAEKDYELVESAEDVDAQINSQNEAIKQLNSALNSMEHNGHLPLVEANMVSYKYIYDKEPEMVDIDDLPLDACNIQYASIDGAIKAYAEDYSFNIESELFPQLTKEQQVLWRKEIEQACISGGYSGLNLAKDLRYKENVEVKDVDLELD